MPDKLPDGKLKIQPWHMLALFLLLTFAGPLAGRMLTSQTETLSYSEFSRRTELADPAYPVKE